MKLFKGLAWAAVVGAVGLAGSAPADDTSGDAVDCGESVTAEILQILLDAGNIDRGQYAALCRKAAGEAAAQTAAAPAATPDVSEGPPKWKFKWDNTFKLAREDGAFKLQFGGRAQMDAAFISVSNDLRDDFIDAGIDPRNGWGTEARRARFYFSGTVYDRIVFKAQYDFAQPEDDDNPDFKDVYMGLKDLGPVGELRVGHFKEPMMLEEWTSSKYITFMERGLNEVFYPRRNVGVMASGRAFEKALFWQGGVFQDTNDQAFAFNSWGDGDWDLAARAVGVPIYRGEGAKVLHLGGSYIHRFRNGETGTRFHQQPTVHLAQRFADTGTFDADGLDILNLEASGVWGPLSVQTELTNTWVAGGSGQRDLHFWGGYAYLSYFLTGEHRRYDLGNGRFARQKPVESFNPVKGSWGAWELAARYSYLDLNHRNITGGKLWDITAGLNWYLTPNLRWMLNYVHSDVRGRITDDQGISGAADTGQMRFMVDF